MRCFLTTYKPLVISSYGVQASEQHGIPPFVDGSIRREPDFEHPFPSITCVCRGNNFAPRLRNEDVVVYMTVKKSYEGSTVPHRKLVAVLKVIEVFKTHENAANWYRARQLQPPRNCLVPGNPPLPLALSSKDPCDPKYCDVDDPQANWDAVYWRRTTKNGAFAVCEPLYTELGWQAKIIHDTDLVESFNRVPRTRNPGEVRIHEVNTLMKLLQVPVEIVAK